MHFVLTPVGSGGDVHPYIGIGARLRERGRRVTLVAAEPFRELAGRAGLEFESALSALEYERVTRHPDLWHPARGLKLVLHMIKENMREAYRRLERLHGPGETVLVGHTLSIPTRMFEEKHGTPAATLHLSPNVFRSTHRTPALGPGLDISGMPRFLKRAAFGLLDRVFLDPEIAPELNEWRHELGLPPIRGVLGDWMHSPRRVIGLFPDWFGDPQPDWPSQVRLAGFPLFDAGERRPLDPALEAFLDAGEPPIAFTPGTANRQAGRFFAAAVEATAWIQRKALLLTPFPEQLPADLPPHVRHVPYLPFSEVLPRCAAMVHHGGIGSIGQGLAAGIPQLLRPMAFDQPDNALRVERLGVGSWLTASRFIPQKVAPALRALLESDEVAAACRRYRDAMRGGNPVGETCDLLERLGSRERSTPAFAGETGS